jgi:hypothetical protein
MAINISTVPYPNMNDTSSLLNMFLYVNGGTQGYLFPLILLALWVVIFISSLAGTRVFGSASRAFTFASLFCGFFSVALTILDLLNKRYMYILVIMFAAGLVWMILQDSRD